MELNREILNDFLENNDVNNDQLPNLLKKFI